MTRAMAAQLAPHKIRVNAIVPNKIGSPVGKDEFDPTRPVPNMAKRPGQPEEAAKAVLFLASEDSSFVYGQSVRRRRRVGDGLIVIAGFHAFALSRLASGLLGSASSPASTGMLCSISRRASAISRWALIPHA